MPLFDFKCEVCGRMGQGYRKEKPPRFCSIECRRIGLVGTPLKKIKYVITDDMHEQIKKVYQRPTGNGEVMHIAARFGVPRYKITQYAASHGWIKTGKNARWTEPELKILKRHARHCPEVIQRRLKKDGYSRTINSISLKRRRMRLSISCLDGYSARSLAMCLGVDMHFVTNRIKKGDLKASRRETNRNERQGGNIYWIKHKDIRDWVVNYMDDIDITKVDKYWFIDLLTNNF